MSRTRTAIVFPGIGYHTDKPLLYYAKQLAREFDYRIVEVPYGGFEAGIKGNPEKMHQAFEHALAETERILSDQNLDETGEFLLISKSIGTAAAAAWQDHHNIQAANIWFTPVEDTFTYMRRKSGIVFHGTADPWAKTEMIRRRCGEFLLPLYLTEEANHSLECGDACRNLDILQKVMKICREYIKERKCLNNESLAE